MPNAKRLFLPTLWVNAKCQMVNTTLRTRKATVSSGGVKTPIRGCLSAHAEIQDNKRVEVDTLVFYYPENASHSEDSRKSLKMLLLFIMKMGKEVFKTMIRF